MKIKPTTQNNTISFPSSSQSHACATTVLVDPIKEIKPYNVVIVFST